MSYSGRLLKSVGRCSNEVFDNDHMLWLTDTIFQKLAMIQDIYGMTGDKSSE